MDKVSYALGMTIARNLKGNGVSNLDVDSFAEAVRTVTSGGKPEISEEEAGNILDSFFRKLKEDQAAELAKEGTEFLRKNAERAAVTVLPSGLQYEVMVEGAGRKPSATDKVRCHYEGTLVNGTVFDSSYRRGEPAVFGVNQVIQGWVEALQLMSEGSKWRLYIPYDLAYGEHGAGGAIPPYSALIFDVELIEIVK